MFEFFHKIAEGIVDRYMSPDAYEQALSKALNDSSPDNLKFTVGEPYSTSTPLTQATSSREPTTRVQDEDQEVPAEQEESFPESTTVSEQTKTPKVHTEEPGFTGDRVLANVILFKMEYSWWIEAAYAIPEGDIGRVWEILKVSYHPLVFPNRVHTYSETLAVDLHLCWWR